MIERRAKIGTAAPVWFQRLEDPIIVQNAVGRGGVQYPGDDRVHLDRLNSFAGPVSSRTRHQCQPPDNVGVVKPIPLPNYDPLYDAEGYLTIDRDIRDLRWDKSRSNIECRFFGMENLGFEWWPLTSINPRQFSSKVYQMLEDKIRYPLTFYLNPKLKLERMARQPSPHDIIKFINQAGHLNAKDTPGYRELSRLKQRELINTARERNQQWNSLKDRWDEKYKILALWIAVTDKRTALIERSASRRAARVTLGGIQYSERESHS